jgi:MFS transporter, PAT family, beta-lactamase induction signal transducer AmpG
VGTRSFTVLETRRLQPPGRHRLFARRAPLDPGAAPGLRRYLGEPVASYARLVPLFDVFRSRRVLVIALVGFSSGLPLLLTGQTLSAWMADEGVDLTAIGAMSLVGLPYTFKWVWAPLLDRYRWPFLGRRRGWLLVLQLSLIGALAALGSIDPRAQPVGLAAAALVVAFLSASLDVVVDAFNTDTLRAEERAAGGAMYVSSYRAAMLVAGAFALALADHLTWRTIYWAFAALMAFGVVGTLAAREPAESGDRPTSLGEAVRLPLARLLRQPSVATVLVFVALFKFGDHIGLVLVVPFLKSGVGFSFPEIAMLYHVVGFAGTLAGGVIGGGLASRHGLRGCLLLFGALQASANLGWAALAAADRSIPLLTAVVLVDNAANAMGTVAFVAYLMSRCERAISATQYALLTSLSSVGGRVFGFAGAALADAAGWPVLWLATAAATAPALLLVRHLPIEERPPGAGS